MIFYTISLYKMGLFSITTLSSSGTPPQPGRRLLGASKYFNYDQMLKSLTGCRENSYKSLIVKHGCLCRGLQTTAQDWGEKRQIQPSPKFYLVRNNFTLSEHLLVFGILTHCISFLSLNMGLSLRNCHISFIMLITNKNPHKTRNHVIAFTYKTIFFSPLKCIKCTMWP